MGVWNADICEFLSFIGSMLICLEGIKLLLTNLYRIRDLTLYSVCEFMFFKTFPLVQMLLFTKLYILFKCINCTAYLEMYDTKIDICRYTHLFRHKHILSYVRNWDTIWTFMNRNQMCPVRPVSRHMQSNSSFTACGMWEWRIWPSTL